MSFSTRSPITKTRVPTRATKWPPPWMPVYETNPTEITHASSPPDELGPRDDVLHSADAPERVPSRANPDPADLSARPPELAGWPIPWRQRWGELSNRFEDEGVPFPESERRAFAQVKAEMGRGDDPSAHDPGPAATTGPPPATAGLLFGS
jgi:hypothetical protein